MKSSGSLVPNQEGCSRGVLLQLFLHDWSVLELEVAPEDDDSIVKSQYGRVSFGFTCCRLASNVFDSITWLVKIPKPSWNWFGSVWCGMV